MKFKKGDKRINKAGRPVGSKNANSERLRLLVVQLIEDNWHRIEQAVEDMKDVELARFIERLLRHVLPAPIDELQKLSDEDIKRIAEELRKQYTEN